VEGRPIRGGIKRHVHWKVDIAASLHDLHDFIVKIGVPAGDNIDDDQTHTLSEIAGALRRKGKVFRRAVLVAGTDQFDETPTSVNPAVVLKTRTSNVSEKTAGI